MTKPVEWVYTDIVKDHFANPRNILSDEASYTEDGKGLVGNVKCGDQMMMVIKVDKRGVITDCRWKTFGCASAIASTSILSEKVKGMKVEDAYNISPEDIAAQLGGLPEHKIHCSVLGDKALRAAIDDYYKRSGMINNIKTGRARVICRCMDVTDEQIKNAVLKGALTYQLLKERTKAGTVCGKCKDRVIGLLEEYAGKNSKPKEVI
ncbi:MAG: iron-sulfur cluster assembly scaffold protein [Candidatus Omnitrophota bacterium]|jgi:nitrogen fixation NifU-like protein